MIYEIYWGEIKPCWGQADNPYAVLKHAKEISCYDWLSFLAWARQLLQEEWQIDWGSFGWTGTGAQIEELVAHLPVGEIEGREQLRPAEKYGVVFIEVS